jgi:2-polyprenyl-6-methoxyphenol hydroxylase-like FAD-dependent oxidoreductase
MTSVPPTAGTPERLTCAVAIVGGGPVGMTAAAALGARGIDTVVVERRGRGAELGVKANHVSARSMEIFRRLGVAGAVRAVGLPDDFPHDVAFRTRTTGIEFARTRIPSRRDRGRDDAEGPDVGWPTPEPAHRVNQRYLEPVLRHHLDRYGSVRVVEEAEVRGVEQSAAGVRASGVLLRDGEPRFELDARFLIGCDGAGSLVRRSIGARLAGTPEVSRWQSSYVRAPDLLSRIGGEAAWMTLSVNRERSGTVIAVDGGEHWLVHSRLTEGETETSVDRDAALRAILGVGGDFRYELLSTEDWVGRRLVADRIADGRVFLCGDAAHLWVPFSGYGMNAGIADAEALTWMLCATLSGWGGPRLLDAYAAERQPITEQVSHYAMGLSLESARMDAAPPPALEAPTAEGDALRSEYGDWARDLSRRRHTAGGLNFGYFYDSSPVIAYDGGTAPAYDAYNFEQSTTPGCRTPHVWLADGRSLYDALHEGFTLVRTDPALDVTPLERAAADRGVPFTTIDIGPGHAVYDTPLVLSRPDAHVAWRGHAAPEDAHALIDLMRGASTKEPHR